MSTLHCLWRSQKWLLRSHDPKMASCPDDKNIRTSRELFGKPLLFKRLPFGFLIQKQTVSGRKSRDPHPGEERTLVGSIFPRYLNVENTLRRQRATVPIWWIAIYRVACGDLDYRSNLKYYGMLLHKVKVFCPI